MLRHVTRAIFAFYVSLPAMAQAATDNGMPNRAELQAQDSAIARQSERLTHRAVIAAQNAAAEGQMPYKAAAAATGIPEGPLLKAREKRLKAIDVSDTQGRLYVFVSPTTMPKAMIRAYARDAAWTGAILVVRGLPPHTKLSDFVRDTLLPYAKAGIALQIDPRLYDAFNITAVPAQVYTTALSTQICARQGVVTEKLAGKQYTFDDCDRISPNEYWKVTGAVTTLWALRQFRKQGAHDDSMIRSLRAEVPYHKQIKGISREAFAATITRESTNYLIGRYLHGGDLPGAQMLPIFKDQGR